MKLEVNLRKESIERLEQLRQAEEGVGLIRQGSHPPFLDVYDAYKKSKREDMP